MRTLNDVMLRIQNVTHRDFKGIDAMMIKVFEEGGELAEAVNIHTGAIKHKTTKEPLVGEVADLMQCAMAVLVRATPGLTDEARLQLLIEWLDKKTDKWESVLPVPKITKGPIWRKPRVSLRDALSANGIVPTKAPAINLPPPQPKRTKLKTNHLPKVHVLIRKHPAGLKQPLGERRVINIDLKTKPGRAIVHVQGGSWDLDLSKQTPSFLTFRVNGTKDASTLQNAVAFWKQRTMTTPSL